MKASNALKAFFDRIREKVTGDRSDAYGDPILNHMRIADLWNVWLKSRTWGPEITPYDVAAMVNLMKFARCQHRPMDDSHEDIAGYAAVMDFIYQGLKAEIKKDERSQRETPQDTKKQDVQPYIHYRDGGEGQEKS